MDTEFKKQNTHNEELIKEQEEKITWFRQNQKLLKDDDDNQKTQYQELNEMKLKVQQAKEDKKRIVELEKKCRLLEETAKAKNPNSIGMLIQASKTEATRDGDQESTRLLNMKIEQLKIQLDNKDDEFDKKLRTMRQEQERIK